MIDKNLNTFPHSQRMVRVSVNIFEHEDEIVGKAKEKYGFRNKNDALNFIIRKFEKHLKEIDEERIQEVIDTLNPAKETAGIFDEESKDLSIEKGRFTEVTSQKKQKSGKPSKKKSKKLKDEKGKQSITSLKNILSER